MKTDASATQRKKKAARACIHCQKAHLTCDDSRPCQRCIKRCLDSTCTDGVRKKAKYLQDAEEDISDQFPEETPIQTLNSTTLLAPQTFIQPSDPSNLLDPNALVNFDYGFGSSAANLEYSFLTSMLYVGEPNQSDGTPTLNGAFMDNSPKPMDTTSAEVNTLWQRDVTAGNGTVSSGSSTTTTQSPFGNVPTPQSSTQSPAGQQPQLSTTRYYPPAISTIDASSLGTSQPTPSGISSMSAFGDGAVVAKVASPGAGTGAAVRRKNQLVTPEMVYASIKKPFSYAEGYHYLINYVREKMSREDLMRISRALALFRPSVLASMMNLTVDDLVFTERCLQRTLLEYEKLVSYSGTPTVVWRRTGEIALVGKEFSLLTQWSRDILLNKKTYIYELMSNPSAVEYWEKYALHAFDNSDSAVYSSCILLSPTKRVVPCTFCFTIKRDIFDLPSVIIGNFLPILS